MKNLGQLKTDVWDRLGSSSTDPFYPAARVIDALNTALTNATDRLSSTTARRRYMKRIADLSAVGASFNATTLVWTLPTDFRRPLKLVRDTTRIEEVEREEDFNHYGTDGYMVIGRELHLTKDTIAKDLEVWYVYKPPALAVDGDTPDWVEGYEELLVLEAAALLLPKAEMGDPTGTALMATRMWPQVVMAARASALPANINQSVRPYGEHWR